MNGNFRWVLFLVLLWQEFAFAESFVWPIGTANFDTANGSWLSTPGDGGYFSGYCHIGEDMMTHSENTDVHAPANDLHLFALSTGGWSDRNGVDTKENVGLLFHGVTNNGYDYVVLLAHISRTSLKQEDILPSDFIDNAKIGTLPAPGYVTVRANQVIGKTGFYSSSKNIHLHVSVWLVPSDLKGKDPFSWVNQMYSELGGFGRTSVNNCGGLDRNTVTRFKNYIKPSWFFQNYKPAYPSCLGTVCGDAILYHSKLRTSRLVLFGPDLMPVTDVGWRPLVDECEKAQQYFYLVKDRWGSSKFRAVVAPNTICSDVVRACFPQ